ncbi:ubiquinol-cytochrome C reductase UQCRX/QCR9-like family protein [Perilla frutescens var. hirtella]|uniref:Complex III subunit 9 n=1 Tax=Perilla frutescens var. hirtella TaxID=608512 RepID=A0AAD4IMG9_PERFH|nr:ubiquinol-cytochrome C reductase UQCRX/QCR9-like family protein [Perilla frutescens var. hirtella]KAH6793630.1 ubiquinol-cytochrome C reductase UQCRX/QCR9-like family protein [Perilla frutescens var. hirtella]
MEPVVRRSGGGAWEGLYRLVMRRTPVYVTFVVVGAFLGERAVDRGIHALWDHVNAGLRFSVV